MDGRTIALRKLGIPKCPPVEDDPLDLMQLPKTIQIEGRAC
jgi:hypothetical protein